MNGLRFIFIFALREMLMSDQIPLRFHLQIYQIFQYKRVNMTEHVSSRHFIIKLVLNPNLKELSVKPQRLYNQSLKPISKSFLFCFVKPVFEIKIVAPPLDFKILCIKSRKGKKLPKSGSAPPPPEPMGLWS